MSTSKFSKGFSLVETLMYVSILVIVVVISTGVLLLSNNSFKSALINRTLGRDGQGATARSVLEIRQAVSIDVVNSVLGSSTSTLAFTTTNDAGTPISANIKIIGNALYLFKTGSNSVPLTSSSTKVTTFKVDRFSTTNSEGVNFQLTLSSVSNASTSATFRDTAIVRGGY